MRGRATDAPRCCRRWKPISNASMRSGTTAGGALARAADRGCSVTTRSRMPCTLRSCCASRPTQPAPPRQRAGTWQACSRTARCRNGCRPPSRSRGRSPSTKSADAAAARSAADLTMPVSIRLASWLLVCSLTALGGVARAADGGNAPFTVEDLVLLKRITDPQLSPDGRQVAFVQRETDLDANKGRTSLWLLDLTPGTAQPRRLTDVRANDSSPRWSPDSRTLYFLSARSGSSQVWRLALSGGDPQRVTDYPLDVGALKLSPRGDLLALSMEVFPDCATLTCTRERLDARAKDKATGRTYERLFIRHWDAWSNGTRSHLFTAQLAPDGAGAAPIDVSKGFDADIPGKHFGGDEDFAFSPDGKSLVFSARIAARTEPWSTNFDLFQTPVDGSAAPANLTASNPAWDAQPVFLANGDLAWLAQERPGFDSDRFHIMLKDARSGAVRSVTGGWDRSVHHLGATPDGKALLASVDELGQAPLYRIDPKSGTPVRLVAGGAVEAFSAGRERVVYARADLGGPADLYSVALRGGEAVRLTDANHERRASRHMGEFEQFSFTGCYGETVFG